MDTTRNRDRLARHALTRFWHAHAWAGVTTALLVYVMFFLGAVVLFYRPLTIWEEPLLQQSPRALSSLESAVRVAAPESDEFYLYLPSDDRALPKVGYFLPDTTLWRMWWLDVDAGVRIPEREKAAAFVYDLHYLWHDVTGYWLQYGAGVLVFGFLLALITGALIHLGRFGQQLFQFRPEDERRVLWSDLHKVAGVFGLPFQLVYALTGSMMVLSPLLFQLSIGPVFGGDAVRAVATAGALVEEPPARDYGPPVAALALDELVARARAIEPRLEVESVVYRGYRHAEGTVDVRGPIEGQPFGDGLVRLNAATGAFEAHETPDRSTAVGTLARWIHGLHTVEYGGPVARWVLFVLALGGCVTLLTGNWIWIERRAAARQSRGNALLAKLTAGVGVGCFAGLATLLLASRLLPLDMPGRIESEELALAGMFGAWIVLALLARDTAALWWRGLALSGVLLLLAPIAAIQHSALGLFGSGPRHAQVLAVDSALLAAGFVLLGTAAGLRRRTRRQASGPSTDATAERAPDARAAQPSAVSPSGAVGAGGAS